MNSGGIAVRGIRRTGWIVVAAVGFVILLGATPSVEGAAAEVLTLTTTGNGSGYVTSSPAGIDCGRNVAGHSDCSEDFPEFQDVTLTVTTTADFKDFTGDCTSSVLQCTLNMDGAKSVNAEFGKYDTGVSMTTNDAYFGQAINSQAALEGGLWPKQGSMQFFLYGPDDATCSGSSIFSPVEPVNGMDQVYLSGDFTPTQPGVYRWRATYSGDDNNNPSSSACNSNNSVAVVNKAPTFIANNASDTTIGGTVSNTATLGGGQNPGGTITMNLYAPGDTTCAGQPVYTENINVSGNGPYSSGNYTPTQIGTYRWISEYSGDVNNSGFTSPCSSSVSRSIVTAQTVSLTIQSTDATVGSSISATANLTQGQSPTGTIEFRAYAPGDTDCSETPYFSGSRTVSGNDTYQSASYTAPQAGAFRWIAAYSGDSNNAPATTLCNASGSTSTVAQATPGLSPPVPADITIGSALSAQTELSAGYAPSGSLTFTAYGPNDATCSQAAAYTSTPVQVAGNDTYGVNDFTPESPGAYRWIVTYSGDDNNAAETTGCGQPSNVSQDAPTIGVEGGNAAIGEAITATASLTGGFQPTGTITFYAYGPDDLSCSGEPAFTWSATVDGNGNYDSGDFTPAEAGTYRWIAAYSGDVANEPESSACGDAGAESTVTEASPAVTVTGTDAVIGSPIQGTADLADGFEPGGTVTLRAYGPEGSGCSGTPAFTTTTEVNGNGEYESDEFDPTTAGDYRWTAEYSGDVNNEGATSTCGEDGATSTVAKAVPVVAGSASGDIRLGGKVNASTTFSGGYEMTGQASFSLYGPDDPTCAGEPVFTASVAVNGNGTVTSPDFEPTETGTYRWTGSYSGDANNAGFTGTCEAGLDVEVSPKTCPTVKLTAIPYKPAVVVKGRKGHGVRARILVSRPSTLAITAKIRFEFRGKTRTLNFEERSLRNGGTRNLRLLLPGKWRKLPLGTKVKLTLRITATPREPRGCTSPPTTTSKIKTRVFRVLSAKQR